jgi:hypothetical protein
MPRKQHLVNLSEQERQQLQKVSRSNHHSIREKTRARILLLSDLSCPVAWRQTNGDVRDMATCACNDAVVVLCYDEGHLSGGENEIRDF